jgi:hypothetical protein
MLDADCATTQLNTDAPPCVGSIKFGGFLCSPDTTSYTKASFTRFGGAPLYRLSCTLPSPKQVSRWLVLRSTLEGQA